MHAIGLFEGMFEKNILTFNPGWNSEAQQPGEFTDVRESQRRLKERGIKMIVETDESSTGPASFMIRDPDGNTILVDQHVYPMPAPAIESIFPIIGVTRFMTFDG